ncbi:MAG: gliding motility-associated C-terminal domain-containing protein [Saprospiraceae bacterium]
MCFHRLLPLFFLLTQALLPGQSFFPGDLAVLGVSANTFDCGGAAGGDEISFVCFKDIPPGAAIDLTDNGFERCNPGQWGDSEGSIRFTRTGGTIPAGTVVTYRLTSSNGFGTYQFVSPDADWSVQNLHATPPPATAVNMNSGGDQLYFLAGGNWTNGPGSSDATYSGNVLFGFNSKNLWQADCLNAPTQNSNLHPDVAACAHMEPTAASDFVKYTGSLAPGNRLEWADRIRNPANWSAFADCAAYSAASPNFAAGLQLAVLPTQIGIAGGVNGVCPGDTAFLQLLLPTVGGPFSVNWTDGVQQFSMQNVTASTPLPIVPTASAIFSINGLTDENSCSIQGDLNVKFFLEVFPRDSIVLHDTTCVPAQAGVFPEKLTNRFGCDSLVTRVVFFDAANCAVALDFAATPVSCAGRSDGSLVAKVVSGAQPFVFQWVKNGSGLNGTGQLANLNDADTLRNLPGGNYRFTITDANGVSGTFSISLFEPPPLAGQTTVLSDFGGFAVRCADSADGQVTATATGGIAPYKYEWLDGQTTALADSLPAGIHAVIISDANQCELVLTLTLDAPPPLLAAAEAIGESCFGKNNGQIRVTSTSGGLPPYLYAFENQAFSDVKSWGDLMPGIHIFGVQDANGCAVNFAAVLPVGPIFTVSAGADTLIFTGDSLLFELQSSRPIDTLVFAPPKFTRALGDGAAWLFPEKSTLFEITAYDTAGCVATDDFYLQVKRERSVFVPNVFSPNAQQPENQRLAVFADPGVAEILLFRVFDRWGNFVFENSNFPPNDIGAGWDGKVGGRVAPTGVYSWFAQVRFTDGRGDLFFGDTLLAR